MYLYPGSAVLGGWPGNTFCWILYSATVLAASIQVYLRVITLSLFLYFETCVLLGKPSTLPGLLLIISQDV